ncbi:hypothetical protein ACQCT3_17930 [Sutcliffiella horikoshii]|uniref:hypothetical protein n=1 Tax=Sutcliffiella horikoshii TaxID=79883 RepID=UPI003CF1F332
MDQECNAHVALKVEIDHMKEDINNIKEDQKEDRKFYRETIDALKENVIQLTVLQQKSDERLDGISLNNKWAWGFVIVFVLGVLGAAIKL